MSESNWMAKWSKDQIRAMLLEQFQAFWRRDIGIERTRLVDLERAAPLPHAVIISGLRRVGKSTLLAQLAHRLGEDRFYYVNFEDERFLGFATNDANDLYALLIELFGERGIFVIDEIQNVPGWEHFVRRLVDLGLKFYITGPNASLLSREFDGRMTGRYVPVEVFPFSFSEFLRFRGYVVPNLTRSTTADAAHLQGYLGEYLRLGGIPEPLKYPQLPLARTLYDDVLYRDIATRHRIEDVRALKELAFYLMSNPASPVSFIKLKEHLRFDSVDSVKDYIDYLETSWLVLTASVYDYSVKRRQEAPKKVYAIDTGLAGAVGLSGSPDTAKFQKNLVFLALRRRTPEVYYYTSPGGYEVDFYLPGTRELILVSQNLAQPGARERDARAMTDALRGLDLARGLILTDANADPIQENGMTIEVRSLAEWLQQS
jgi:predicted AAA+ superfamily ATPase